MSCKGYKSEDIITNGDKSWQRCNQELAEIRSKLVCDLCANANTCCYAPAESEVKDE